jgi:Tol biopolymer transport system component
MRLLWLLLLATLAACDGDGPNGPPTLRNKIAFLSDRDGFSQLYIMNTDGTGVRLIPVTAIVGPVSDPAVSPNGEKIAFRVYGEIWIMNADGSGQENLTNNPANDAFPSWSPDGDKILFGSDRDGNSEIYVMNADGTNPVNLTNDPGYDNSGSYSPDGTRIVFGSHRDGNGEIYVMNADGTNPSNLTNDPSVDGLPAWSSDGTRLAFLSTRNGGNLLFTMLANGSNVFPLNTLGMNATFPDWSPGDSLIAFEGGSTNSEIQLIRPDGTGLRNLTQNGAQDRMPSWSPPR